MFDTIAEELSKIFIKTAAYHSLCIHSNQKIIEMCEVLMLYEHPFSTLLPTPLVIHAPLSAWLECFIFSVT